MELRMLSGLHRGGVLELDAGAGSLTLGASPQADVLLADAGIAATHCQIVSRGARWHLEPSEGRVFDAAGQALRAGVAVEPGQSFRVADVWIGFYNEGDPWPDGAPMPAAALQPARAVDSRPGRYPRMKASLAGALLAVALLPTAAWFVSSAWGRAEEHLTLKTSAASTSAGAAASVPEIAPASPASLAEEFIRGLAERELTDRLQVNLQEDHWDIRGSLDADEQQRFERLLVRFFQNRKPSFPIKVTLVSPAELLPFKVVEVINGKGAGIVTDSGERIFVGDIVQGYRLSSVELGKVVFIGKQRVEVML